MHKEHNPLTILSSNGFNNQIEKKLLKMIYYCVPKLLIIVDGYFKKKLLKTSLFKQKEKIDLVVISNFYNLGLSLTDRVIMSIYLSL